MAIRKVNNISKIIGNMQKGIEKSLEEIGVTGVANIQSNTPIDTGALKRSITFKKAKSNKKYQIIFGSALNYSIFVEFKGKSKGFFRKSLNNFSDEARAIIKRNISQL